MIKPFARIEETKDDKRWGSKTLLVGGVQFDNRFSSESDEFQDMCDVLNAAHRAEVRKELEAFKKELSEKSAKFSLGGGTIKDWARKPMEVSIYI